MILHESDVVLLKEVTVPIPSNEGQRLQVLRQSKLLDSDPNDAEFDRITSLASRLFKVAFATITFIDANRQWFKSKSIGAPNLSEIHRNVSFCSYSVLSNVPDVRVIPNLAEDHLFSDHLFVAGPPNLKVNFYNPSSQPY